MHAELFDKCLSPPCSWRQLKAKGMPRLSIHCPQPGDSNQNIEAARLLEVATEMGCPRSRVSVASLRFPFLDVFQGPRAAGVSHVHPENKFFVSFILSTMAFANRRHKFCSLQEPNRNPLSSLSRSPTKCPTEKLLVVISNLDLFNLAWH